MVSVKTKKFPTIQKLFWELWLSSNIIKNMSLLFFRKISLSLLQLRISKPYKHRKYFSFVFWTNESLKSLHKIIRQRYNQINPLTNLSSELSLWSYLFFWIIHFNLYLLFCLVLLKVYFFNYFFFLFQKNWVYLRLSFPLSCFYLLNICWV